MTFRPYTRRDWLRLSTASALGVSFSGWLPRLAKAAKKASDPKSCILLWMSGGPSQLDTFDPKPGHENGGPIKAIETAVPGIQISGYLPGVASNMKDLAIIRDMNTGEGDHGRGAQLMLTGYKPNPSTAYPSMGSLLSKELGSLENELPNYVSLSSNRRIGRVGGPGFLGPQHAPLVVSGSSANPSARANLSIENLAPAEGITKDAMTRRFAALDLLQKEFDQNHKGGAAAAHRANAERAARMIESQAKNAFRLDEEKDELREAYGRNRFGQGCLLARRLVERGVPFVEVELSGTGNSQFGWDSHSKNFEMVKGLCDVLDPAWSTLMNDLRDRGMLEDTLIVWMGEFGRTPKINKNTGRDHWAGGWSAVLGGAGIAGGQVHGDTGEDGMALNGEAEAGTQAADLYATICAALDIDHEKENETPGDRPIALVEEGGEPIEKRKNRGWRQNGSDNPNATPHQYNMQRTRQYSRRLKAMALLCALAAFPVTIDAADPARVAQSTTSIAAPNAKQVGDSARKVPDETFASYHVVLLLDKGPIHARFGIALQGRPVEEERAEYLAGLIEQLDTNNDGRLTRDETNASTIFRRVTHAGTETFLRKMNLNSKQVVSDHELDTLVKKVAGQAVVFRQNDEANQNDDYLFDLLDEDSSGVIENAEMATAAQRLIALDVDEDDCIGFDEVQPPSVPDANPQLIVNPMAEPEVAVSHAVFSGLMRRTTERLLPNKLIEKYDLNGNGKLSPEELRWTANRIESIDENNDGQLSRSEIKNIDQTPTDVDLTVDISPIDHSEPALTIRHCLGEKMTSPSRPEVAHFVMHDSTVTISYRPSDPVTESLDNARRKFNALDVDTNGFLDKKEIVGETLLERSLFDRMDANNDGRLFSEEMDTYVRERATVKAMACRINIFDIGSGFFQTMDHNNDGRISVREMRSGERSLQSLTKDTQPGITREEPNRRYSIEFSRGSFRLFGSNEQVDNDTVSFNTTHRLGPAWFVGSDRNNDGDLAWSEFLGHREDFHYLDLDGDGLIDPIEAARAEDLRD